MKTITPFLVKFAITASLLTLLFRMVLSYAIGQSSVGLIIAASILYGLAMFFSGSYFGRKDGTYLPIYDVGFRFHAATYIVHISLSELWFLFGFNASVEKISVVHTTAAIWGVLLLVHAGFFFWAKTKSINNLKKEDLFD